LKFDQNSCFVEFAGSGIKHERAKGEARLERRKRGIQ